jgi:hypothetical protein
MYGHGRRTSTSALQSATCALPPARCDRPGVAGFVRKQSRVQHWECLGRLLLPASSRADQAGNE